MGGRCSLLLVSAVKDNFIKEAGKFNVHNLIILHTKLHLLSRIKNILITLQGVQLVSM